MTRTAVMWAVLLRLGPGAALSHQSAAELHGLGERATRIHVTVPAHRRRTPLRGVAIHRSSRLDQARHPSRTPPQTTIEETVVDLTQSATTIGSAAGWLARAVGARLTTCDRLAAAMAARRKLRWRRPLARVLEDVAAGCHSYLELLYLRDGERAHGLPRGERQHRRVESGQAEYADVVYRAYLTAVELDGRASHAERHRDMRRDNRSAARGHAALRYGYEDVCDAPCASAVQVGGVLSARGWPGRLRRCKRVDCVVA